MFIKQYFKLEYVLITDGDIKYTGNPSSPNDDASTTSLTSWSPDDEDYDRSNAGRCQKYGCCGNICAMEPRSQCTTSTDALPQTAAAAQNDDGSRLDNFRVFDAVLDDWRDVQNVDVTAQGSVANDTNSDKCDTSRELGLLRSSSITDGGLSVDQAGAIGEDEPVVGEDDSTINAGNVACSRQREPRTTISGPQLSALLAAFRRNAETVATGS